MNCLAAVGIHKSILHLALLGAGVLILETKQSSLFSLVHRCRRYFPTGNYPSRNTPTLLLIFATQSALLRLLHAALFRLLHCVTSETHCKYRNFSAPVHIRWMKNLCSDQHVRSLAVPAVDHTHHGGSAGSAEEIWQELKPSLQNLHSPAAQQVRPVVPIKPLPSLPLCRPFP